MDLHTSKMAENKKDSKSKREKSCGSSSSTVTKKARSVHVSQTVLTMEDLIGQYASIPVSSVVDLRMEEERNSHVPILNGSRSVERRQ